MLERLNKKRSIGEFFEFKIKEKRWDVTGKLSPSKRRKIVHEDEFEDKFRSLTLIHNKVMPYTPAPKISTKGINFPKFSASSIMFCVDGPPEFLFLTIKKFQWWQHQFYSKIKNVKCMVIQGEYAENGRPHLQCFIQAKRPRQITSLAIYKMIQPLVDHGLQCTKCKSPKDAWHYCTKPHDGCDCEHCVKARLCKPNWFPPVCSGEAPVGQGKKFARMIKDIQKGATTNELFDEYAGLICRYPAGFDKIVRHYKSREAKAKFIRYNTPKFTLKPWEMMITTKLFLPKGPREIHWAWSKSLATGKSTFLTWLACQFDVLPQIFSYKDLVSMYKGEQVLTFNFSLNYPHFEEDGITPTTQYKRALELIENVDDGGCKASGKYAGTKVWMKPHIVVCANVPPPARWIDPKEGRVIEYCLDPKKQVVDQPAPLFVKKFSGPILQKEQWIFGN